MRQSTIQGDGYTVTVRGRTRRTLALQTEYLVSLKENYPDLKEWTPDDGPGEEQLNRSPRAVSLAGVASQFRFLIARVSSVASDKIEPRAWLEPFAPDQLIHLFDHYLDSDQDGSDLWSKVEAAITRMDTPEEITDPNSGSGSQMKSPR